MSWFMLMNEWQRVNRSRHVELKVTDATILAAPTLQAHFEVLDSIDVDVDILV
jgi:hypothetical protein